MFEGICVSSFRRSLAACGIKSLSLLNRFLAPSRSPKTSPNLGHPILTASATLSNNEGDGFSSTIRETSSSCVKEPAKAPPKQSIAEEMSSSFKPILFNRLFPISLASSSLAFGQKASLKVPGRSPKN